MGQIYQGDIPDVLTAGEYDQGDRVLIYYDDLYDLVHPREKKLCPCCNYPQCGHDHSGTTPDVSKLKITSVEKSPLFGPQERVVVFTAIFGLLWIGVDFIFTQHVDWHSMGTAVLCFWIGAGFFAGD